MGKPTSKRRVLIELDRLEQMLDDEDRRAEEMLRRRLKRDEQRVREMRCGNRDWE